MSIAVQTALADDQNVNMWEITFPDGIPGGGNPILYAYRADKDFDKPNSTLTTYEVKYQGMTIPKTAFSDETDKKFTLRFRGDSQMEVYKGLERWFKLRFDDREQKGGSEAETRTTMLFRSLGAGRATTMLQKFSYVQIFDLKEDTWSHEDGNAWYAEAQFLYAFKETLA